MVEEAKLKSGQWVSFADWKKIDAFEKQKGEEAGKLREKVVNVDAAMAIVKS